MQILFTATNAVLWHIAADLILPAMGDLWISSYKFHYKKYSLLSIIFVSWHIFCYISFVIQVAPTLYFIGQRHLP